MSDAAPTNPEGILARSRALAHAALPLWDLKVVTLEPIKIRENAVFRLDLAGGARAVLRVHRSGYHSDSALASEFVWMRALAAAGIRVPEVVPSRAGRDFESVMAPGSTEPHQVDVLRWINGRQLGSVEGSVEGDEVMIAERYHTIGSIMAHMHNQAVEWRVPPGFVRHAWDAEGLVGERPLWGRFWDLAALRTGERDLLLRTRALVADKLTAYGKKHDRYGLIHADLVPENILVDGVDIRIIDFDDAGFGWHWFDIATSLYFISGEGIYPTARDALLGGYQTVRPLPGPADEHLPVFMAARATTYLGWVHTRQGTETAIELTPYLVERACAVAADCLAMR